MQLQVAIRQKRSANKPGLHTKSIANARHPKMALISCPDCGHNISDQAAACISCGRPIKNEKPIVIRPIFPSDASPSVRKKSSGVWIILGLIIAAAFVASALNSGSPTTNAAAPGVPAPAAPITSNARFIPYVERVATATEVESRFRTSLADPKAKQVLDDEVNAAISRLKSVPQEDPAYQAAKKTLAKFDDDLKKDETRRRADLAKIEAIEGPKERKELARPFSTSS